MITEDPRHIEPRILRDYGRAYAPGGSGSSPGSAGLGHENLACVRRVAVIGNAGSGKSTLARALAARLGVPYVELDGIYHQPGWIPLAEDELVRRVGAAAAGDGWVIDGNYGAVRPLIWARADTVVWLDPPRRIVMRRLVWRTIRRVISRTELWNGNREPWQNLVRRDPQMSIIAWAWRQHAVYQQRYAAAALDPAWAHLRFSRVTSRRDVRTLLDCAGPLPRG
jgi:adenylate kinase family enzyme